MIKQTSTAAAAAAAADALCPRENSFHSQSLLQRFSLCPHQFPLLLTRSYLRHDGLSETEPNPTKVLQTSL